MFQFEIREYDVDDVAAILRVAQACSPHDPIDRPTFGRFISRTGGRVDVACGTGGACEEIFGFVAYRVLTEYCAIAAIGVDLPFRRRGIGRALLERVLSRTNSDVSSTLSELNTDGLKFLKHHGFVGQLIRRPLEQYDCDAVRMIYRRLPAAAEAATEEDVA